MGAYSAQVSATVLSTPTITAPVSLSASLDDQQTTLTWQAPPGAGTTITGYEYRYAESTAALPATWSDAGNDLTETITGLTNGTQYTFEVRAMSSSWHGAGRKRDADAGRRARRARAGSDRRLPPRHAQLGRAGQQRRRHLRLSHRNAEHPEPVGGGDQRARQRSTSYTDSGLSDSTVYTYRVIAENAAGRSSASNSDDATTLAQPAQVPGAPTLPTAPTVVAVSGPGKITLSWMAPLFNGGSPVTRYDYRYKVATASSYGGWTSATADLTVEVDSLTPGTPYHFEVRAVNSAGAGTEVLSSETPELDVALRTPGATAPTAVPSLRTSLGTHAGNAADEGHESNAAITVNWNALPATASGCGTIDSATCSLTGYELCYKKSTDSAWMRWDAADAALGTPSANGSVWSAIHGADAADGLLDPGTTYQYRARALNSDFIAGTADTCTHWDGAWSNVVSARTPEVEPNAPVLHASDETPALQDRWVLNVNSITIKWTAPTINGGADITSYEVLVRTPATQPEVGVGTDLCVADDAAADLSPTVTGLPPSRTEYINPGLAPNTVYCYRVRARNGSGDSRVSVWSDEVRGRTTVTQTGTPGAPGAPTASVTVTSGDVAVSWDAPSDNGTSPITSYEVEYQRTDDGGNVPGTEDTADAADWSDAVVGGTPTPPTALTWTHMQAPGLSTFRYRVRAVNGSGAGAWAESATAVSVGARAAGTPMLTATTVGMDEILLEWTKPDDNGSGFTGYTIQRRDDSAETPTWDTTNAIAITGVDATLYSDRGFDGPDDDDLPDGLAAGTKYSYRIQTSGGTPAAPAFDDAADPMASATTMGGLPEQPTITAAAGTGDDADTITVSWTAPGSGGSDITGYQIRVWDGSNWALEDDLAATATSYEDEGLAPGTRYYYILAARNSAGYGPWSASATAMTEAGNPDAPVLNAVATGDDSIQLTWNVPNANGATITEYQLQRWDSNDDDDWGDNLLATGDTVTEFVETGLEPGTKYYYRIRAMPQADDASGWSATDMSDGASATTHGDTPGAPTVTAPAGAGITANSLTVTWVAPTATGGSDITGYMVQIFDRASSRWVHEATLGDVTEYMDTGLTPGTKYYYRVQAINSQGGGLWSAFVSGTTTAGNPDAPVLTATSTGMTTIRLTWNIPDYNGATVEAFVLQKWDGSAWGTTNLLGTTPADTIGLTLFVDSGLNPGTTYYYRIRVTPQADANTGWSTIKSAMTDPGAPGKPELTATPDGQNAINLTWTAAPANGSAIVRYELQVWNAATRMWDTVRNDLPSSRTSYKHSGLTAGTKYAYRLRGVNRAADNNGLGAWSTIKFADTAE